MGEMVRCIKEKKQVFQKTCAGRKFSALLAGLHVLANDHLRYYFSDSPFFCCRLKKTLHKGVENISSLICFLQREIPFQNFIEENS